MPAVRTIAYVLLPLVLLAGPWVLPSTHHRLQVWHRAALGTVGVVLSSGILGGFVAMLLAFVGAAASLILRRLSPVWALLPVAAGVLVWLGTMLGVVPPDGRLAHPGLLTIVLLSLCGGLLVGGWRRVGFAARYWLAGLLLLVPLLSHTVALYPVGTLGAMLALLTLGRPGRALRPTLPSLDIAQPAPGHAPVHGWLAALRDHLGATTVRLLLAQPDHTWTQHGVEGPHELPLLLPHDIAQAATTLLSQGGPRAQRILLPDGTVRITITLIDALGRPVGVLMAEGLARVLTRQVCATLDAAERVLVQQAQDAVLHLRRLQSTQSLMHVSGALQRLFFPGDDDQALRQVGTLACRLAEAEAVAIYTLRPDHSGMQLLLADGVPADADLLGLTLDTLTQRREEGIVYDALPGDRWAQRVDVPLRSGPTMIGLMALYQQRATALTPNTQALLHILADHTAAAQENALLLGALESYASDMIRVVHLSRVITTSLDLDVMAETIAQMLASVFGADVVGLFTLADDDDPSRPAALRAAAAKHNLAALDGTLLDALPELADVRAHPTLHQRVLHTDAAPSHTLAARLAAQGIASCAVVPLAVDVGLIGLLLLGHRQPRLYTAREWQVVEAAANIVATQVQNATLHTEVQDAFQRRLQHNALLEGIAEQVTRTLDPDTVMTQVLHAARQVTGARVVLLVQRSGASLRGQVLWHHDTPPSVLVLPSTTRLMQQAIDGHPDAIVEGTSAQVAEALGLPLEQGSLQVALAVPLHAQQGAEGVLAVAWAQRPTLLLEMTAFLHGLAGHAVIALQNARYHQRQLQQLDVMQRLRQLALDVPPNPSLPAVSVAVLQAGRALLGATAAALYDTTGTTPYRAMADTYDTDLLAAMDAAAATRTTAVCAVALDAHPGCRLACVVPMGRSNPPTLTLVLALPGRLALSEDDLQPAHLLASQASNHIEAALLTGRLHAANKQMRAVLDAAQDAMLLLDARGNLLSANRVAAHHLGVPVNEWVGLPFPPEPVPLAPWDDGTVTVGGRAFNATTALQTRRWVRQDDQGGVRRILQAHALPLTSDSMVSGQVITLRDVTLEIERDTLRRTVLRDVVHDLRGPLASIASGIRLAQDGLVALPASPDDALWVEEPLLLALDSADRLQRLVSTLLDLESAQIHLNLAPVTVRELVRDAQHVLVNAAREVNITLTLDVPDDLPLMTVDAEKVGRVLVNLLDNALDYGRREVVVRARLSADASHVQILVNDDGPGIAPEQLATLFLDGWATPQAPRTARTPHNGIGLSFCKRIVLAHNGTIAAQSAVDAAAPLPGACIVLSLPVNPASADRAL